MRAARSVPALVAAALALSSAVPVRADDGDGADLRADEWRAAGITAGALALTGVLAATWKPSDCRICTAPAVDEHVRDALVWTHPKDAQRASDLLANVAVPVLAGADAIRSTSSWGNAGRDVLVVAETVSLSTLTTEVAKNGFARLRPGLPASAGQGASAYQSLWSGHTQLAFSIAASQAMQDTMRGDAAAPWVWAVGMTLATAVGYFRIAGDEHWLTDVVAGAAVGTAFGGGVPLLEQRLVHGVTIAPAPGGFALRV